MASTEDFYSSRPASGVYAANPLPDLHKPEPPPPPPPKSNAPEPSRHSTPAHSGPPLPPLPSQGYYSPGSGTPVSSTPQPPPHPSQFHQSQTQQQGRLEPQIAPPAVTDNWIPEVLVDKHTTDLAPILSNPTLLTSLASSHPSYASSQVPLSSQLSSNISFATRVQETASHLVQLREQTQALLLQHTNLSTQWRRKQSEMDKALEPWSPKAMYQRLVASITEQEAVIKALEESFLEGSSVASRLAEEDFYGTSSGNGGAVGGKATDREVGEWVKRIREGVQTLEMRKEMRERWDEGRVGGWR